MATRTEPDRERLKRRRIEAGLSMTQLGKRTGISKQLISMVEGGRANFSPENLGKVAEALKCEIADLLPVDEALARAKQLVALVAEGRVTLSLEELPKVAEALGCQISDLDPDDLSKVADALGCRIVDLLPETPSVPDTKSAA